jgi:hypothetical protein
MDTTQPTQATEPLRLKNGPSLIELGILWANGAELVTGLYLYFDDDDGKKRWQLRSVEMLERDPRNSELITIVGHLVRSDGQVKERRMQFLYHRTLRSGHTFPAE